MNDYEPYDIQYDASTRKAIVFFRGQRIVLAGPYDTEEIALEAGKLYLRKLEWQG